MYRTLTVEKEKWKQECVDLLQHHGYETECHYDACNAEYRVVGVRDSPNNTYYAYTIDVDPVVVDSVRWVKYMISEFDKSLIEKHAPEDKMSKHVPARGPRIKKSIKYGF